jgi:predicted nucleic acid-binding protein
MAEEKKEVYVETSVVSNLTARPSHNPIDAAAQIATHEWWCGAAKRFDLFVSRLVESEAAKGNPEAASRRLSIVKEMMMLPIDERMYDLAERLLKTTAVPRTSFDDAVHIATAAIHGVDYLVTWNCSHIANVETRPLIRKTIESVGFVSPEICTPLEMKGDDYGN